MIECNLVEHYFDKQDREVFINTLLEKKSVDHYKVQGKTRSGELLWISISAKIFPKEDFLEGIILDITEKKNAEFELQQSEMKYHTIADFTYDWEYWLGVDGTFLYVSPSCERITGYAREEFIADPKLLEKITHPDDLQSIQNHLSEILSEQEPDASHLDFRITTKKRDMRWISHFCQPVFSKEGVFLGVRGSNRDITEYKKYEELIVSERNKLEIVTENIGVGLALIDKNHKTIWANEVLKKIFGDVEGKTCYVTYNKRSDTCPGCGVREIFEKKINRCSHELSSKDALGNTIWSEIIATPIKDDENNIISVLEVVVPITEKKKAELKAAHAYENIQRIINSASELIISIDQKGKILLWNKTAEILSGYKQKEVLGKTYTQVPVFENVKEIKEAVSCSSEKKMIDQMHIVLKTKSNIRKVINVSCSLIKSADESHDTSFGCLFIGRDITKDIENHGKLLIGNSYLVATKDTAPALDLFISLLSAGYIGLYITRNNLDQIKTLIPTQDVKIVLMSEKKQRQLKNISTLDSLAIEITAFCKKNKKPVVLLDRLDYLLNMYSFEQVSKTLYTINEIISECNALFLVHLDPVLVDERQFSIIQHEIQPLPSQKVDDVYISSELFEILQFIENQNVHNMIVSFNKIGKHFSIVDKTTTKRLRQLEHEGLIFIKKQGRLKTIHVSEKGKQLLNNRKPIE